MQVGCSLSGIRSNIVCYADDICLLAPSPESLQLMLNSLNNGLKKVGLTVNVMKCAYIVFKNHKSLNINSTIQLNGIYVPRVADFKYLGTIVSESMVISADISRVLNSFLKQYNSMYSKFYKMNFSVLKHLFKTYTNSFYGLELWYDSYCHRDIHKLEVTYHKAVKRIAHLNVWDSNHEACEIVDVPIFKHLFSKRIICFYHSLINSNSPCLLPFKTYFKYNSCILKNIKTIFASKYEVNDVMANPLCAIISRINYVQLHEPRRR